MADQLLPGRVALVAGASRGIGAATAEAFATAGAAVVLAARDIGALNTIASRIEANGGTALAVRADVRPSAARPRPRPWAGSVPPPRSPTRCCGSAPPRPPSPR